METTGENEAIAKYLTALRNASTDNERFAALLMVAKVSKETSCDIQVKKQILDAVGRKFFSRLLKTKNVPEDCAPTVFKSVAMSILSALCKEPEIACSPVLTDNVVSFNSILLQDPDEADKEGRELVDATYECVNSLCQAQVGLDSLKKTSTVSALCEVLASRTYGWEKAQDVLLCLVSRFGGGLFDGCELAYHSVLSSLSLQFQQDQSLTKFELCKTLVFLLTAVPNMNKEGDPPWAANIVGGLDNILRSKVGKQQREPALRLASMLVDSCGVSCLLPPTTPDNKLFLLTTHLCCVEVRMVLEDPDMKKFQTLENGRLLSSCYGFLECVINYMTGGPTLSLDDRQVLQLHAAMVGAFGAVTHFLKRVSEDPAVQWNSTVLATVRVLAAWLSEETSALKEEVYELIPFLIQISKLCIPPEKEMISKSICPDKDQTNSIESTDKVNKTCESDAVEMKDAGEVSDSTVTMETDCSDTGAETGEKGNCEDKVVDSDISGPGLESGAASELKLNSSNTADCDKEPSEMQVDTDDQSASKRDLGSSVDGDLIKQSSDSVKRVSFDVKEQKDNLASPEAEAKADGDTPKIHEKKPMDLFTLESLAADKEVLSDKELSDLHVRVDICHFLLPAVCHFTADDEPRQLLVNCGALSVLDLYMWRQWELFIRTPTNRDIQSSLLILCNIFLNFTIVDPTCVTRYREFSHILLLAVKGVHAMELSEEHIGIWSHLVTLGLMLLRQLHQKTDEFLEPESLSLFYASCVKFLNGAYKVKPRKKGHGLLELAEEYKACWEQISQTWFLSMQALSACIPLLGDIPVAILKSGWLPSALKTLSDVRAGNVAEEVRTCYLLLFSTVAQNNEAAMEVIKEKGGIEFARAYKSKEFLDILQN